MPVMEQGTVIEGSGLNAPFYGSGAPVDGTDAVQDVDITGTPTGGTFKLKVFGVNTVDIDFDAAAGDVEDAIETIVGAGNVGVSGSNPNFVVTFGGDAGKMPVPLISLAENNLTGGTTPSVDVTDTTPGVAATGFRPAPGARYIRQSDGTIYVNQGTALDPNWDLVTIA